MRATTRGVFLACSWMWCIGLFLPALLISDFGALGWAAFAIPNVLGAALVGLLWTRPASERAVAAHRPMMAVFSAATLLFHVSFLAWFLRIYVDGFFTFTPRTYAMSALALFIFAFVLSLLGWRGLLGFAWVALLTTLVFAGLGAWTSAGDAFALPAMTGPEGLAVLWVAPVLALGFLTCPHLDLTFHVVRQESPGRTGAAAFLLGFGVIFLAFVTLSMLYGEPLLGGFGSAYIPAIIALQAVFTCSAHFWALRRAAPGGSWWTFAIILLAAPLAHVSANAVGEERLLYDLFLSLYALPFAAYVWIFLVPRTRLRARRSAQWGAWTLAIGAAAPAFWLGSIERRWWWLSAGAAVVLISPALARALSLRALRDASAGPAARTDSA